MRAEIDRSVLSYRGCSTETSGVIIRVFCCNTRHSCWDGLRTSPIWLRLKFARVWARKGFR